MSPPAPKGCVFSRVQEGVCLRQDAPLILRVVWPPYKNNTLLLKSVF